MSSPKPRNACRTFTSMAAANHYLTSVYRPAFNAEFMQPPAEAGSAFVPWIGSGPDDILCEQFERTVGNYNYVRFENLVLQKKVRVHRYPDNHLAVFHGSRTLATYDAPGKELKQTNMAVA